jgi:hypothetical protein
MLATQNKHTKMFKQKLKISKTVTRVSLATILSIVVVASFVAGISRSPNVAAATNSTINFQARLLTAAGGVVPDGLYNVEFKLYDTASSGGTAQGACSGNCVWMEARESGNKVRVVNGYLTVNLGSVTAFGTSIPWDQELWLTMNIGGTGVASYDGEMTPRLKLTSVPYALRAGKLVGGSGANVTILDTGTPSGSNTISLPAESGTLCIQSSSTCGFIQSQSASDQTASFRISGTGRANTALQAPLFDTPSATILAIGTTNATAINLNQDTTIASGKILTVNGNVTVTGTYNTNTFTPSALTFGAAATATISSASGQALTLTSNATATWSVSTGNLSIQAQGTLDLGSGGGTAINLGTNNAAHTIVIGNQGATGTQSITMGGSGNTNNVLTLEAGTGASALQIGNGNTAHGIRIGTGAAVQTIVMGSTNSTSSLTLQSGSSGTSLVSGGNLTIGAADATSTLLVLDSSSVESGTIAGAMYYNTSLTKFRCYQGGAWVDCINTAAAGVTTVGTIDSQTKSSNGAVVSGTSLYLQTADGSSPGLVSTVAQTIAGAKTFTGAMLVQNDSNAAFSVQSTGGSTLLSVNTNSPAVGLGATGSLAVASTVNVGTSTGATQTVSLGGTGGAAANGTTITIQGGNGSSAVGIQALASGTIAIGTAASNVVTIGSTTSTAAITLGQSTNSNTIAVGSGNPAASQTQTISIGNGSLSTSSSAIVVNILSGSAGSNGTATLNLANNDRVTAVNIGNVAADAARTLNLFTGDSAVIDTLNIGTGNTTVAGGKTINIGTGTPTASGTNLVTVGSITAAANVTTIQGGNTTTGNGAVSIQAATSGVITIGTANSNQINLGGASSVVKLGALGTVTANATAVCRDASTTNLIQCDANTTGRPFLQGGNSFGASGVLGTNDSNSLQFETNNVVRATFDTNNRLYLGNGTSSASPNSFVIQGTDSATTAVSGGSITLQGGNATTGSANGGNITITGGTGTGTGVQGLVVIGTPTFATATTQTCTGVPNPCAVTQANVDSYGAVVVNATATGVVVTLPNPTINTYGRIVYVTAASGSSDFTLSVNGGGTGNLIAMRANTSATMVWGPSGWTAAGASSSTTLQAAYDNTLASAGGAEIVLNNTATSNGLTIRNGSSNPIIGGGLLEVQTSIGTNLFSVNNNISELVANGGGEDSSSFATNWTAAGTATISRTTTASQYATGAAGVSVSSATANSGVRNNMASNPAVNTRYLISFTAKLGSGAAFTDLRVEYTPTGANPGSGTSCITGQTIVTTGWTRITCEFQTPATTVTNADIVISQVASPGGTRVFYIDNLSMTLADDAGGIPNNVQIGGGIYGGSPTLFTLDRSSAPPVANGNTTYLGSMYYDTTTGRIQCYEADGWGACGSAPDNIITLTPEYSGAVLNGTGIGTMSADFCANQAGVLSVNTSFCASGISRNYYKWTSPQASQQTYSIYVSYKLPTTFKTFIGSDSIGLTALTDDTTDGTVDYEVFRSSGSAVTSCGSQTTVTTPDADTWYQVPFAGDETACGFAAGDSVIFKINVRARNNASVYVENLDFSYTNR